MHRHKRLFHLDVSNIHDLGDSLLSLRALRGFGLRAARFPVFRSVRFTALGILEEILDRFALQSGFRAHRPEANAVLLDGKGLFIKLSAQRKTNYLSGAIDIWADSVERLENARARLLKLIEKEQLNQLLFTIDWHFTSPGSGLTSVAFDELADPELCDEAYPALGSSVRAFIERYLAARETVLILQGPPGTGKTRLVRAILAGMSQRKGESAKIMYTADKRTLEQDEVYVDFLTGSHDAFVVEDADHLLGARSKGNVDLHRFLAVADGIVRAQGRKIIFTTNLPNIGDIDEALMRPGRCFGVVPARALTRGEASALVSRLQATSPQETATRLDQLFPPDQRSVTLAALYRALDLPSDDLTL